MTAEHGPRPPEPAAVFNARRNENRDRNLELADNIQNGFLSARQRREQTLAAVTDTIGIYEEAQRSLSVSSGGHTDYAANSFMRVAAEALGFFAMTDLSVINSADPQLLRQAFQTVYSRKVDLVTEKSPFDRSINQNIFYQTYSRFSDRRKDVDFAEWTQFREDRNARALLADAIDEGDDILFDLAKNSPRKNKRVQKLQYFPREESMDLITDLVMELPESSTYTTRARMQIEGAVSSALRTFSEPRLLPKLGKYGRVAQDHFSGSLMPFSNPDIVNVVRDAWETQNEVNAATEQDMQRTGEVDLGAYIDYVQPAWDTVDAELVMQALGRI